MRRAKTYLAILTAGTAVAATAAPEPASATPTVNALSYNGLRFNGVLTNALSANGLSMNGVPRRGDGTASQRPESSGPSLQFDANAATFEAVRLPEDR